MGKRPVEDPILAYNAEGEINNLQWGASQPDWVSIAFNSNLQIRKWFAMFHIVLDLESE
jgi:hypothetical protein